ncbi:MAG: ABC transporter ATP-binding protein [Lachnospiraceae bacterium]|nr:ABC transporter ATP-binding protein [Lachnospiraceae bacterium]MCR5478058.1 ABC transporter ATP-binding protein/permease [Lachnospiraceae bacterium]
MIKILKKLKILLDAKQKRTMAALCVMMVFGALLQTLGVSMLVQVVNVVIDPEAVRRSETAMLAYRILGTEDFRTFSILVMALLILVFIVKNLYLYLQQKAMYSFVYTNQFRTSERMMRNFLRRDYEFFLNADTAVVQRSITSDVNNMYALILTLLQLVSDGVVSLCVGAYCLFQSGMMTVLLAGCLLLLLLGIKKILKPIMYKAGEDNQNYYSGLFKWISQTVQGIKEVKIFGRETYFVDQYKACGTGYVNAVQKYSLYSNVPKLLIETVCVAVMVGYMIVLTVVGSSTENMLSMFATLAAAALVLLPAVNRINNQISSIAFFEPFFLNVSDNLQDEISADKVDMTFAAPHEKVELREAVTLEDIVYAYPNTEKKILDHTGLTIPVGASVGIVGSSGAGKSTVVDILLGLLKVQEGRICVDGKPLGENYRGFLKNVGYIPQMIFMLDDSIRRNVAFGISDEEMDEKRIWEVLAEAQLDEFVRSLPEGLETQIGERGIRISGGQRQRIGIARALYHDPEVLILDEATSALDNDTESAIMESINYFAGKKTLVIIAHRLQTIEKCGLVYRVENGQIQREK